MTQFESERMAELDTPRSHMSENRANTGEVHPKGRKREKLGPGF